MLRPQGGLHRKPCKILRILLSKRGSSGSPTWLFGLSMAKAQRELFGFRSTSRTLATFFKELPS